MTTRDQFRSWPAHLLIIFLFTFLYLLLHTRNAGADSWYYGACVKYGRDLFQSHHLLYAWTGRMIYKFSLVTGLKADPLHLLFAMNAVAAGLSLLVLFRIFKLLGQSHNASLAGTALAASSFGFMRYAADAETYVMPVLFSLLSVHALLRNERSGALRSGLFASMAILFHQVHVWWTLATGLGMLMGGRSRSRAMLFAAGLLPVAAVYMMVYLTQPEAPGLLSWLGGAYASGEAGLDISARAALLTVVNLFRSFFQVHGYLLHTGQFYLTVLSLVCMLLLMASLKWFRPALYRKAETDRVVFYTCVYALPLQILFAFLSSGNAEFMVMLPFLMLIASASVFRFEPGRFFFLPLSALLTWNVFAGLVPQVIFDLNGTGKQISYTLKAPRSAFLWKEKALVENRICYAYGFGSGQNVLLSPKRTAKEYTDSLLREGVQVFTDLPNRDTKFSRAGLLRDGRSLTDHYRLDRTDSFINLFGKNYIYRISSIK